MKTNIIEKARVRASKKKKAAKSKKETPIAVKVVSDDTKGGGLPSGMSSYEKDRAKEKKANGGYDKYEIEEACRSLEKADEVRKDKKLMAACLAYHGKKHARLQSLADIKGYKPKDDAEDY